MICLRGYRAAIGHLFALATAFLFAASELQSQATRLPADTMAPFRALVFIGGPQEDRVRVSQLIGASPTAGSLIRSVSSSASDTTGTTSRGFHWTWARPFAELTWNSAIPFSLNDGAQWAGRGSTVVLGGGIRGALGPAAFTFMPQLWRAENDAFAILPGADPTRSSFTSPWHDHPISVDLPVRLGVEPTTAFDFGESAISLTHRAFRYGVSTESQWWGPGIRNALLISNNAGGIPHLFLQTAKPVATRAGDFEGRWIVGGLSESRFFDSISANDLRSLSGAVVTFVPAAERNFTGGVARVVYSNVSGVRAMPGRALDVIGRWSRGGNNRAAEQLLSLFGRWVFPNNAAEVYGEWSRVLMPSSLHDLLVAPQFTQGFTVGTQWAPAISDASRLRLQVELTTLEQSPQSVEDDTISYYSSSVVPQGYTQRGQVIGAAIGPGGSSQWFALDVLRGERSVGAFIGRIRWDTDAYYRNPTSITYNSYDVSVFGGIRAAFRFRQRDVAAELTSQRRLNFLFQNAQFGYASDGAFDKRNATVRLRVY